MGRVEVSIEVWASSPDERPGRVLNLVVETSATIPILPGELLESMGVRREQSAEVELANGSIVNRSVGVAWIRLNGETAPFRVLFGEPGDAPVLGVVVLETFRLAVDPVHNRLTPTRYLYL